MEFLSDFAELPLPDRESTSRPKGRGIDGETAAKGTKVALFSQSRVR